MHTSSFRMNLLALISELCVNDADVMLRKSIANFSLLTLRAKKEALPMDIIASSLGTFRPVFFVFSGIIYPLP